MSELEQYENFLDFYILNFCKMLKDKFIANRYMKEILKIPAKDLMGRRISKENKQLRKDLTKKFLKIIRERNYEKDVNIFIAP